MSNDNRSAPPPRSAFPYAIEIATRWSDNDIYGHVNNVVYYSFFDTVINRFLIEHGLDIHNGPVIGLAVETGCRFSAPFSYPEIIEARLRVVHLGRSSVRYEVGLFGVTNGTPEEAARAKGTFVHVFVDRETRRPMPIPDYLRTALSSLQ